MNKDQLRELLDLKGIEWKQSDKKAILIEKLGGDDGD